MPTLLSHESIRLPLGFHVRRQVSCVKRAKDPQLGFPIRLGIAHLGQKGAPRIVEQRIGLDYWQIVDCRSQHGKALKQLLYRTEAKAAKKDAGRPLL